jgi:DNA-binding Lrp family transcriptional regulator
MMNGAVAMRDIRKTPEPQIAVVLHVIALLVQRLPQPRDAQRVRAHQAAALGPALIDRRADNADDPVRHATTSPSPIKNPHCGGGGNMENCAKREALSTYCQGGIHKVSDTDRKLIALLRRNARASVSDIAAGIGVSRATVRARLDRLIESGEILGFTVILKSDVHGAPVQGVILIGIEGKGTERVIAILRGMPEVQKIHTTNGRWDLIAELGAETLADLDAVLRRIRLIDGVANSETNLFLSTRQGSAR